ncbi:MAG: PDZ domain-containing protein [Planctomycetes bacterium]|nr:PDZ domain-containing protein [Planctomycetota bacterium]
MSQDSEGKVSVTVTEEENGVSTTKTYSADSMEEFREKYPEVADKYDLGEDGGFRIDFGPGLGGRIDFGDEDPFAGIDERLKGHMEGWRKQFDEQMRDLDRLMEDLRQGRLPDPRLRRRFPIPPKAGEPDDEEEAPPEKSSGATPIFGATLSVLDPALRYQLDLPEEEGVLVESVVPGSPAEKAGLNQYDVILKVNGESVVSALGFRRQWKEAARSLPAEVTVVREGRREVFRVEAGPAEENR